MNINIHLLSKSIASTKLKNADKINIRELEEEGKNNFIAFADDGDNSFDVNVRIDEAGEVQELTCDCESKVICIHKIAMLKKISKTHASTTKPKKKTRTKASSALEVLLQSRTETELRIWLQQFLSKNKDALYEFNLSFSEQKKEFTTEEVRTLIDDAIKSVIGRKKSASAAENKKIVDLLHQSFEPVIAYIQQNSSNPIVLDIYSATLGQLYKYYNIYESSTRYSKFLIQYEEKIILQIHQIKNVEQWSKIVFHYWDLFFSKSNLYIYEMDFIFQVFKQANEEQKVIIGKYVVEILKKDKNKFSNTYYDYLLDVMIESNCFLEVKSYFKTVKFENIYNQKLLNALRKTDPQMVIEYCYDIIHSNYQEYYNLPYYDIIIEVCKETNDMKGLAKVYKTKLMGGQANFSDYPFIKEHLNNEEIEEIRKKFSKINYTYNLNERIFIFELLGEAKNYKKMINMISSNTIPAHLILKDIDQMLAKDKENLILNYKTRFQYNNDEVAVDKEELQLLDWMLAHFDRSYFSEFSKPRVNCRLENKVLLISKLKDL